MIRVLSGDCLEVLRTLEADSFHACATDPPYHLTTGKRGGSGAASVNPNSPAGRSMIGTGFMGKAWDGGDIAMRPETWAEVFRVLKPGGHLLCFGGTRTSHRMVCAIEDAGFEIRDSVLWLYGTGFPKSHDISKAIDKRLGAVREVVGIGPFASRRPRADHAFQGITFADDSYVRPAGHDITAPVTPEAAAWDGWGSALKPGHEPIILARKPLIGTLAANVLRHGCGGLNIDGCRIGDFVNTTPSGVDRRNAALAEAGYRPGSYQMGETTPHGAPGRWPANVLHDGSDEVMDAFAAFGEKTSGKPGTIRKGTNDGACYGAESRLPGTPMTGFGDTGTAARFFYCAKASAKERAGSTHPTVKPIALMRYLCRLITPPGGHVLDPFAGSGTTGEAAALEGFDATLIEREAEYVGDTQRRIERLTAMGIGG